MPDVKLALGHRPCKAVHVPIITHHQPLHPAVR